MKEIDWTKPIEQTDGGGEAYYLRDTEDGSKLVTHKSGLDWITFAFRANTIHIRNKPELIKPEGWVAIRNDRIFGFQKHSAQLANAANYDAKVSFDELISGKFKDGIPKGYGLGGEDD